MIDTKREAAQGTGRVLRFQGENAIMSSPILPAQGPTGPTIEKPAASLAPTGQRVEAGADSGIGDVGTFIAQLAAGVSALSIEAGRGEGGRVPDHVLDQITAAARIGAQLREAGHELRFFPAADGGRVQIEVHDRDGNKLGMLSPAAALELAAGSPLN